jgi:hypothetical protein
MQTRQYLYRKIFSFYYNYWIVYGPSEFKCGSYPHNFRNVKLNRIVKVVFFNVFIYFSSLSLKN